MTISTVHPGERSTPRELSQARITFVSFALAALVGPETRPTVR